MQSTENSTSLAGAYRAKKKNGQIYYRASITWQNKHISLGSYDLQTDAHLAYQQASALLSGDSTFSPEGYDRDSKLSYDKYVCLMNFRDSRIYIKNPIYLKKNYFEYHYSPQDIYLFDIDDLFYYSGHKIMKRGGHLFVADYGMHVTILSRYGIQSHAVAGRDYTFVNGNCRDLRYENVCVLNPYRGVVRAPKGEHMFYQAKILIRGTYLLGTYATAAEAAIAYNKAIDVLKAAGCPIQYQPNFVEGLSGKAYADIYSRITISQKIYALTFS